MKLKKTISAIDISAVRIDIRISHGITGFE